MRMILPVGALVFAATVGLTAGGAMAANAVQKECSQKYQAAKAANQLNGLTYNQYYSQCAAAARTEKEGGAATPTATPAPAPAPAPTTTATKPAPAPTTTAAKPAPAPTPAAPKAAPTTATRSAPAPAGAAVFPAGIAPEFSKDSPGKARRETCLAQYKRNKDTNGNGGLKWIVKGGGYYSECNKRLKG